MNRDLDCVLVQQRVVGIDEAGRGPLAGPVFAAAVILDPKQPIAGLTDSKKLTEKRRDALYTLICQRASNGPSTKIEARMVRTSS